jgi:hypothetical protein
MEEEIQRLRDLERQAVQEVQHVNYIVDLIKVTFKALAIYDYVIVKLTISF